MKRKWISMGLVLVALFGAATRAQESAQPTGAAQAAPDLRKDFDALVKRFKDKQQEVSKAYSAASTDEERERILATLPGKEFIPEFRAVAEQAKGTETAVDAWMWVLRLLDSDKAQSTPIIDMLLKEYLESEALAQLPGQLRYASPGLGEETVCDALRALIEGSPHEKVQAGALFTLGAVLLDSGSADKRAEGRQCFESVSAEFGDVAYERGGTYGEAAAAYLFELDHLQIGMAAPDFEVQDENGVAWKLSDYKGKVVVIDFWGNW